MTSAARTSFGCCGVISVEDDFSLETTEASWVWVASVRAIKFAFGRLRGTARRRDILQLSWLWFALRRESESVDNNSHACYISLLGSGSDPLVQQEYIDWLLRREWVKRFSSPPHPLEPS